MKEPLDEETYVPLKDKIDRNKRKISGMVFYLILLGTGLFFSLVMVLRTGGMPRMLFVIVSLCLGFLIYEAVKKIKQLRLK